MSHNYEWVRKWGRLRHSKDWFIEDQVVRARKENAPANAIYRQMDGTWATTDDIPHGSH